MCQDLSLPVSPRERCFSSPVQGEHLQTLQRLQMDQTQQSQDLSALRADMKNLQALIHQLIQSQTSSCQYYVDLVNNLLYRVYTLRQTR